MLRFPKPFPLPLPSPLDSRRFTSSFPLPQNPSWRSPPISASASPPPPAAGREAEFGFERAEMGKDKLAGTVQLYDRHVLLCYGSPELWPPNVEGKESDLLPRALAAQIKARKGVMSKKTRLTICEGEDGTDSANGDVLIFPDMIKYRKLTHFEVEKFVEEVLVKENQSTNVTSEPLAGSFVFVCAHGSRDRRCGVCGPALINKFKEEIASRGLEDKVFVSPCSHIGGHKYAGNVIIYCQNPKGEVTGHWFGYVAPDDVPVLLDDHIGSGNMIDHLWRGQMGLTTDDQKASQSLRLQINSGNGGGCQGVNGTSCCQVTREETHENSQTHEQETPTVVQKEGSDDKASNSKESAKYKVGAMPKWFKTWERPDTYVALAVVAAIASVVAAYTYYKQHN